MLKTEESENNLEILENQNDLLDTANITDEKLILEVRRFYLSNTSTLNHSFFVYCTIVGQIKKFRNLVRKIQKKV